jgi:hypothetical protein
MTMRNRLISMAALAVGALLAALSPASALDTVYTLHGVAPTYSANIAGLTPAASATDFFTLTGSATKTVKVLSASCWGTSTANAVSSVTALKRSTANTGGTATNPTKTPHDSLNAAATATVAAYTANPTTGTLVGNLKTGPLTTVAPASTTVSPQHGAWTFETPGDMQSTVLRGTGEVFALNGGGASFSAGASLNCSVTWIEF